MSVKSFYKIVVTVLTIVVAVGCTDQKKVKEMEQRIAQLQAEYEQKMEEAATQSEFLQEYSETINDVYDNLEQIRQREGFLSRASSDVEEQDKTPLREKMLANVQSIDTYLKSSKAKMAELQQRFKDSKVKNDALSSTIESLNKAIEEREVHITQLKDDLAALNIKFDETEWQLKEKETVIQQQQQQLNTVYYIVASEDELKDKGIIEEKGGFLGLRKTKRLAAGFNEADFTPADIVEVGNLQIDKEPGKVKVLSPHNPNSYQLHKSAEGKTTLEITNPQEFWKIRYLVIASNS